MKRSLVAVGLMAALLMPFPVSAQPFMMGHGGMMEHGGMGGIGFAFPLMLKAARLTPEQKAQVQSILAAHRANLSSLSAKLHDADDHLMNSLLKPGELSDEDLAPDVQKISQLRQQALNEALKAALEVRQVLTPDQLKRAGQFQQKLHALQLQMRDLMKEMKEEPPPQE